MIQGNRSTEPPPEWGESPIRKAYRWYVLMQAIIRLRNDWNNVPWPTDGMSELAKLRQESQRRREAEKYKETLPLVDKSE